MWFQINITPFNFFRKCYLSRSYDVNPNFALVALCPSCRKIKKIFGVGTAIIAAPDCFLQGLISRRKFKGRVKKNMYIYIKPSKASP